MSETYTTDSAEALAEACRALRVVCPVHHMPDCSPPLNGCSLVWLITNYVREQVPQALIDSGAVRPAAEVRAEAWDEGAHAGRTYQQRLQEFAHWSHIGKALPDPVVNPYRAALAEEGD